MHVLFDLLLISSPNGGGLFLISNNQILKLDSLDTTGITHDHGTFLRGEQPSHLWICCEQTLEATNKEGMFDDIHDVIYHEKSIYLVATTKNAIIELDRDGSEVNRWLFDGAEDSCHINCLGVWNKRIIFSAFGDFLESRGYKGKTTGTGYVQDLLSGKRLITGLSQPHSLVPIGQNLLVANSEEREIREYAPSGNLLRVCKFDGYTRGICVSDKAIYVGLSCSRNDEKSGITTATLVAVNSESFEEIDRLSLPVNEIYSVLAIDNTRDLLDIIARVGSYSSGKRDQQIANLTEVAAGLDDQVLVLNQQVLILNQAVAERDIRINSLNKSILRLNQQLTEEQCKLASIVSSHSWKITLPFRELRRWVDNPILQAKRYSQCLLNAIKTAYLCLPISQRIRTSHRMFLASYLPMVLLESSGSPVSGSVVTRQTIQQYLSEIDDAEECIKLPTSLEPQVSVIIPVYGKIDYTLRCLKSIAANPPKVAFEVIVVDDCSPDNSAEILAKASGIRLLRNEHNQGFIRSCNRGADVALGEHLYFLNNDTVVTSGWMDELLHTFHAFPGTGLAGSKLIYPDGRLQEAGGIIWQDGSAWNFGRLQDPQLPVYNYAREVDYCSGASIMVPSILFKEVGGFDEQYLPAYCEDSDLALKIRDKGHRVIYQPLSVIVHFEGITSGTDTTSGVKAYQVANSKKLFARWQERLQHHQAPGIDCDKAKDRKAKRRVLVLDHCTPTPNQDAGSLTLFNLLLLLREMDFQVTFVPEDNFLYLPEHTTALQRIGVEVLYAPYVMSVEQLLKTDGGRYDLVFLFRPGVVERNIKAIRKHCPKAKVLYHTVDLHFLRMQREAALLQDKVKMNQAEIMKQREFAAISAADASIVHSTAELELLQPELPNEKIHVFPLIMDGIGTDKGFSDRRDIVFIGGYQHTPNVDAVQFFVSEVMPLLRKQISGVRFYAVGSNPPPEIQKLSSNDVIITGFVEDLNPLLDKMKVSIAPLRYGAGIKGKIGSAMAVGLPVVATSLAAEGMSLTDGENILVADGVPAFAATVVKLYEDEVLWNKLSKSGLEFAAQSWGAEASWGKLANILSGLGFDVQRNGHSLSLFSSLPKAKNASAHTI